jgi:hypothetical protein
MATIWDRRRPIRDGAARSIERNCRIWKIPSAPAEQSFREEEKRNEKMLSREERVEDTAKIATPPSSDP